MGRPKEKWFEAEKSLSGWRKDLSDEARHRAIRRSIRSKGLLRTWNSLLGLANVTEDKETESKARADYEWMSQTYAKGLEKARKQVR